MVTLNKRPPLPFQGNKRNSISKLYEIFKDDKIDSDCIILDLFGGSGLLSDLYKKMYPNNEVIWNDYDNYQNRLDKIDSTNEIIKEIKSRFDYAKTKNKRVKGLDLIVKEVIKDKDVDMLTIKNCTNLCGTMSINNVGCYNKIPLNEYKIPDNYLKDVIRVSMDFKELINQYKTRKCYYIIDPPYLCDNRNSYRQGLSLKDNLLIGNLIKQSYKFILFTSKDSMFKEIMEIIDCTFKTVITAKHIMFGKIPREDILYYA